jgi:hypothetical protein
MAMNRLLLAAAVLFLPLLARADEKLNPHEREMLLARLEDLAGRMAAAPDDRIPTGSENLQARLEVELKPEKARTLAGVTLEQTAVILKGRSELVLAWLGEIRDSRLALTPPYHLRALRDGFEIRLSAWRVQGDRPDPGAPDDELTGLLKNLEWFEGQREKRSGYIAFLQPILDVEAVFVSAARLEKNVITLTAAACNRESKEAFIKEVALRAAAISKTIRLEWKGLTVRPEEKAAGQGLSTRGLDPSEAILLCCEVDPAQVIAALKKGPPLTARIPDAGAGLLEPLLRKLSLPYRRLGAVVVASDRLRGKPPGAGMLPQRPITLQLRNVSPQNLFVLLSEVSRVGMIPPASDRALTLLVRDMPIRNLASAVLWALGLVPAGDDKLMAILPFGLKAPDLEKGPASILDLSASEAPLSLLVEALSGRSGVIACREDPPLTLRVRDVAGHRLLSLLLAGRGKTLARSGEKTLLLPVGADAQACKAAPERPPDDRLYAVIRAGKNSRALLYDGGRLRWAAEGEKLGDGREVRRIRSSRVVLRGIGGEPISLFPQPEPRCPPAGCPLRFDPTATPLSRLRLAGTATTGDKAAAALVDPEGHVYVVRPGQLVGRRCGKVTAVEAGRIRVEMECAQAYDAKAVWVSMRGE